MLVNVFGARGSGKTTLIAHQINFCKRPAIVVDVLGNFGRTKFPNFVHADSIDAAIRALKDYLTTKDPKKSVIVVTAADPSLTIDYMCAALWESNGGTLVLDEADSFDEWEADCYDKAIRYGRNKGIDIITGVRRPAEISRNITAAANKLYAFQTREPRDVEYFEKTVFSTKAQKLMTLPPYHGIFIDHDKGLVGEFRTDVAGKVYHLSEESFKEGHAAGGTSKNNR